MLEKIKSMLADSPAVDSAIKERMQKPAAAAFIFSWCAVNYQLLLTLFSDGDYSKKIIYIENALYPTLSEKWICFAILPACGAAFYSLIVPMINMLVVAAQDRIEIWNSRWRNRQSRERERNRAELLDLYAERDAFEVKMLDENKRLIGQLTQMQNNRQKVENDMLGRINDALFLALTTPGFKWSFDELTTIPLKHIGEEKFIAPFINAGGIPIHWLRKATELSPNVYHQPDDYYSKFPETDQSFRIAFDVLRICGVFVVGWTGGRLHFQIDAVYSSSLNEEEKRALNLIK